MAIPTTGTRAKVFCGVCLKEVPRSSALVSETRDCVAYFCSADCYDRWAGRPPHEPTPSEAEIQLGHGRSKSRDDDLKRIARRHPQRDEPRLDSVEPDET